MSFAIGAKQIAPSAKTDAPRAAAPTRRADGFFGNQAMLRRLSPARIGVQPKLEIGAVDDPLEREADRVADEVMRMPAPAPSFSDAPPQISRKCAACEKEDEEKAQSLQRTSGGNGGPLHAISRGVQPNIRRKVLQAEDMYDSMAPSEQETGPVTPEEPETLQRDSNIATGAVTPQFQRSLHQALTSGGAPLPEATRSLMESRFRRELSSVRVHSNGEADGLAKSVSARAFALGSDIFFAKSQYAPLTAEGQRLLAHELAHVVQQSDGRISRQIRRTACSSYPGYDASIDRHTYNCAGLAMRTYQFTSPPSAVYAEMRNNFTTPYCPAGNCQAGEVKFWLWTYDIRVEDDQGKVIQPTWQDFHIVGGRVDAAGNDPTNVYSKNGPRPIHGPGTGPSFGPGSKDLALDLDDNPGTTPQGRPVYKVRSNMREEISCAGCK